MPHSNGYFCEKVSEVGNNYFRERVKQVVDCPIASSRRARPENPTSCRISMTCVPAFDPYNAALSVGKACMSLLSIPGVAWSESLPI